MVLDPPYMHSPGGTAHQGHKPFEGYYRNNVSGGQTSSKYHEAVLDLYLGRGQGSPSSAARSGRTDRKVPG